MGCEELWAEGDLLNIWLEGTKSKSQARRPYVVEYRGKC
jgi:hypothetical protein